MLMWCARSRRCGLAIARVPGAQQGDTPATLLQSAEQPGRRVRRCRTTIGDIVGRALVKCMVVQREGPGFESYVGGSRPPGRRDRQACRHQSGDKLIGNGVGGQQQGHTAVAGVSAATQFRRRSRCNLRTNIAVFGWSPADVQRMCGSMGCWKLIERRSAGVATPP